MSRITSRGYGRSSGGYNRWSAFNVFAVGGTLLFLIALVGLFLLTDWSPFWIWLLAINFCTFCLYGIDKSMAKLGRLRVPEKILHLAALAGGFAGGWLGMWVFNHKTRKPMFRQVLIVSTVLWAFLALLITVGIR